jgi:hypothetical protein
MNSSFAPKAELGFPKHNASNPVITSQYHPNLATGMAAQRPPVKPRYDGRVQSSLDFVLAQYENQCVGELDQEKLNSLLELKNHTVNDAAAQLGGILAIRDAFVRFQTYLYNE